jgi:hypothetical protein
MDMDGLFAWGLVFAPVVIGYGVGLTIWIPIRRLKRRPSF